MSREAMGELEGGDADADFTAEGDSRRVCESCGRKFNPASYERHHAVCQQVFGSKRPQFDALKRSCSSGGSTRPPPPGSCRTKLAGLPDGAATATAPLQLAQAVAVTPSPVGAAAAPQLDPAGACAEPRRPRGGPDVAVAAARAALPPAVPLAEEAPTRPPTSPPLGDGALAGQAAGYCFEDAHDSSRSWGDEDPPLHALLSSAAAAAGAGRCPPDAHDSSRSWGDEDPALGVRLPSAVAAAAAGHARPPAPGSAEQCAEVAHDGSRRLGEEEWDENPPLDSRFPSAVAAAAAGYTRLPLPVEGPAESSLAAELSAAEAAPPPPRLDDVPLRGGATAGPAALALESDEELPEQELQVCEYCSRRFKPASLEKHRAVCASVFGSRGFRRGPLESQPKRLGKLRVGIAPAGAPQDGSAPLELSSGQASTAASSGGAPSRSRGCNRTGSLSRTGAERARQLCPHCGRSFHSAAFEKHTGVCQRIFVGKASPKPRAGHEARQASSEQRPRPPPPPAKSSTAVSVGLQGRASSVTSLVRQPAPKQPETAASMSRSASIPRVPPSPPPPPPPGGGESRAPAGAGRASGGDGKPRLPDVPAAPSAAAPCAAAAGPPGCAGRVGGGAAAEAAAACSGGGPAARAGRAPVVAPGVPTAVPPAAAPCPSPSHGDLAALCQDRRGMLERARLGHKLGQRPGSAPSVAGQSSRLAWPEQ